MSFVMCIVSFISSLLYLCPMPRILAIDYGLKRCGIAITDPLQIIASPLEAIPSEQLFNFLNGYFAKEEVETIVVGRPTRLNLEDSDITRDVDLLIEKLKTKYREKEVVSVDERFTSKLATEAIVSSGAKKKKRKDKNLIDKVSASLILQTYLGI